MDRKRMDRPQEAVPQSHRPATSSGAACPLCGQDLGLAPKPEEPRQTLETLGHHFASDCPATHSNPR